MNNIFVTQQQKEEWEAKVAELYRESTKQELINKNYSSICTHKAFLYEELLSKAIVLPVEENWNIASDKAWSKSWNQAYPNGVIIKQTT